MISSLFATLLRSLLIPRPRGRSPVGARVQQLFAVLFLLGLAACGGEAAGQLSTYTSDATGFDTHSFYYDTGSEVVVFDAQFTEDLAEKLITAIRARTSSPIRYLIITHPNPDKFNGATAFRKIGAEVVASEATARAIPAVHAYKKYYFVNIAKQFTDASYPVQTVVDRTFTGRYELPLLGGAKVVLSELAHAGVATTQTAAHIPAVAALIVGDLVHGRAHAWLEGGIRDGKAQPDLAAWKLALAELPGLEGVGPSTVVYGGRGESAALRTAVSAQTEYLSTMEDVVVRYVNGLGAKKSELADPLLAPMHYKNLAMLAAQAFPGYAFPYLIEYGVYGLVNAKLAP